MTLRIGFLFPSSDYLHDPFRGDPHTHFQILTVLEARFGAQVSLELIDLRGIQRPFAIRHIPECDLFLQSVYTLDWDEQVSLVKGLRRAYPKALHVAGGPHASVYREQTLAVFDSLVLGEAEQSIVSLVETVLAGGRPERIYRMMAPVDLDAYPFPRRHWLPKAAIARRNMMTLRHERMDRLVATTAIFSRGCPGQCAFCAMPAVRGDGAPGLRYRAPHLIEEEIEYLKRDYGIEGLNLLDEIGIPPRVSRAIPHLEAIGRTGIKWRGQIRVDGLTRDVARLARQSGCTALGMGVESVWQPSLDLIRKQISVEQARRTIGLLKEVGIEPRIYMILGLPGEPPDIVERTWEFIQETGPDLVILSLFTVRPGTEIADDPARFGIARVEGDWRKTMHMYGRYADETPSLTFDYAPEGPLGPSLSSRQIVENYRELQRRLREAGLSALPYYDEDEAAA